MTDGDDTTPEILDAVAAAERDLGLRDANRAYADHMTAPAAARRPRLVLDDVSEIPFLDGISAVEFYQLRARLRAGDGDIYVATCPAIAGYEAYNTSHLQIGAPRFLHTPPGRYAPIAISRACTLPENLKELALFGRRAGGMTVHPYMGNTEAWELAAKLSEAADIPVDVLAPPPPVTWFANNKWHVSRFADTILSARLGRPPTVPWQAASDPESLAKALLSLAHIHDRVAIKMTRCASAMGNALFAAEEVRRLADTGGLIDAVNEVLKAKQWDGEEHVLAVAWLDAEASPSTQLWIPPVGAGPPRVEGVYEQLLIGPEKVFEGSVPSRLGPAMDTWLSEASLHISAGFQALGYVGRCSFDFIVSDGSAYLVECNGRWGGTSIPMHLMDRLFPRKRPAYRARDVVAPAFAGRDLTALLDALGPSLYHHGRGEGRFIVYNVGCLQSAGKFDAIAIGEDVEDATAALEVELVERLGISVS